MYTPKEPRETTLLAQNQCLRKSHNSTTSSQLVVCTYYKRTVVLFFCNILNAVCNWLGSLQFWRRIAFAARRRWRWHVPTTWNAIAWLVRFVLHKNAIPLHLLLFRLSALLVCSGSGEHFEEPMMATLVFIENIVASKMLKFCFVNLACRCMDIVLRALIYNCTPACLLHH